MRKSFGWLVLSVLALILGPESAMAGGTIADYLVLPTRSAPATRAASALIYGGSGTGRVHFIDTSGFDIEAGTADRALSLSSAPSGSEGKLYESTTTHLFYYYDGSTWQALATAAGFVPTSRQIICGNGLTGCGSFAADRTMAVLLGSNPGLQFVGLGLKLLPRPSGGLATDASGAYLTESPFSRACTLTSAAAATPVNCLLDADVGAGRKAQVTAWHAAVNGATAWSGVTYCVLRDTAGSVVLTIPVAVLLGNALINDNSAGMTWGNAYFIGSGSTTAKGLEIACDTNGITGSDLVFSIGGTSK